MKNITQKVNEVYKEQTPSEYFKDEEHVSSFVENAKNFLLRLKLPPRAFLNSTLIDFGCGTGQKSLVYDHLGADCTLVEYDKKSYEIASTFFKKYAINNFKVINSDIFEFDYPKENFDFVLSSGVAHHTEDPIRNIKICCQALKPGGFFIFGISNKAGFFQRNLQRLIAYSISESKEDVIRYSKILFNEHLKRSMKYGGRSLDEVVYDTYVNPRIRTFGTAEVLEEFSKNKLSLYSSYRDLKDTGGLLEPSNKLFRNMDGSDKKSGFTQENGSIFFSDFEDMSLSNNEINNSNFHNQLKLLMPHFNEITNQVNDISFEKFDLDGERFLKEVNNYKDKISQLEKIDLLNKNHNEVFFDEVTLVIKVLTKNNTKLEKFREIKKILDDSQRLFKSVNGVGMNYYCGYKNL